VSAATIRLPDQSQSGHETNLSSRTPVVMPPPILKKSRGPSTTGPRPTARFISPHESENEADRDSSAGSNSNVVVQSPSPGSKHTKVEKKTSSSGRKKAGFVAAGASKKKRPVIVRRQNSQSSADSVKTSDNIKISSSQGSTQSSLGKSPLGRSPPLIPATVQARGKQPAASKFQEQFSPDYEAPIISAPKDQHQPRKDTKTSKSLGQKSQNHRSREGKQENKAPRSSEKRGSRNDIQDPRTSSQPSQSTATQKTSEENQMLALEGSTRQNTEQNRKSTHDRDRNQPLQRSRSGADYDGMEIVQHDRKSSASLAPTLTPATGQLALGDAAIDMEPVPSTKRPTAKEKGKGRAEGEHQKEDIFTKRPVQPVGTPAASEPLGSLARSKSQLTLLLEKDQKDRAKNADKKPNGRRH
jgi:hypothetical protein